ncbi:MAG: hypothetical protein DRZ80_05615 [Thermoprotei archaeon]|nr:MAG: hypothetical protein DRZ80_05615 [Thermoprotei archaeon]
MKIKSKHRDEVRLYYNLGERVEIGDLLEISEDDRSVIVQVVDIEQDTELMLSGDKGLEVLAKIRLEGFGGEFRTYREWSGWFPSSPMLIKRINASSVVSPDIAQERLFIGYEKGTKAPFFIPLTSLKTLNVIAGLDSEELLAVLTSILYIKNNNVLVIDLTGRFHKILKLVLRSSKIKTSYFKLGKDFKIKGKDIPVDALAKYLNFFEIDALTINLIDNIFKNIINSDKVLNSLEKIAEIISARKDMEFLADLISSLNEITTWYGESFYPEDFTVIDASECSNTSALFAILYYLLNSGRFILAVNGIQNLVINEKEQLARLILARKKPVFVNIDVDSETSVYLRHAVNIFFTGPYNRILDDILPLVENEEPLIRKLSIGEFLVNGLATKNTPIILLTPQVEDALTVRG